MPERLTTLDASFLYLEKRHLHMHVGGLAVFDPARASRRLTLDRLRDVTASRLHLVPRFRQKVRFPVIGSGRPVWVDVPVDLEYHIRHVTVARPGGPRELAALAGQIHSQQLDRGKPLWEMYLVDGIEGGNQATLTKTHHAMLDGVGGMDVCALLLDHTPEPTAVKIGHWNPPIEPSAVRLLVDALLDRAIEPTITLGRAASNAILHPRATAANAAVVAIGAARALARGLAPRSSLNTPVGATRRFAMTDVTLDDARAVKSALGGTVNDVILTTVADALSRFLEHRGEPTEGRVLRSMMPASTRGRAGQPGQNNQVTTLFVDLPVGPMDVAQRLQQVIETTQELKASHEDDAAAALMSLGVLVPPVVQQSVLRWGNDNLRIMNLVASNVPGPQIPLYLDGMPLVAYYPLMPLGAETALSIAVVTLVGVMGFGFSADWTAFSDLESLVQHAGDSFEDLRKAAAV
jgi:WS/DGAT/MGAT family acyltransferase